ncbi:alpha/beta fold hydrolase [Vulcanococcus sp.]|jgi:pimeloyl-ACP methyl ester carboxylesterase|uniref:alpha/beta fold hydrolase n=1 Tax=Vulcanococcus sp. TaxID=2856995 RepID=UPI0037D99FE6
MQEGSWSWGNHRISYLRVSPTGASPPPGRAVLCVHGFGASKRHWRHNLTALASGAEVYAIDLLGFGASAKPPSQLAGEAAISGSVRYCFDLWAEQLAAFTEQVIQGDQGQASPIALQLIGNSIGGVVALNAARLLEQRGTPAKQVILIDCAQRELDLKRLAEQPWSAQLGRPVLMALVRQRWLIGSLFRLLARPAVVRQVLQQAYPSGGHVDEELVELLVQPSRDPGASESFRGFVNLFDDWLAPQLLQHLATPVRMLWGEADPWEPVAEAQRWQQAFACIQELTVLPGLGHCPHDEAPEQVNPILKRWLQMGWG